MRFDLQDRDVGLRVAADDLRFKPRVVVQNDRNFVGVLNDVIVGDDVPLVVDEEARNPRR